MSDLLIAKHVIVRPSLGLSKVQRRAVVTFPTEMCTLRCDPVHGMRLKQIPLEHRRLQIVLSQAFDKVTERMRIRGYELVWADDVHVYGPWPSRLFHERLIQPDEITAPEQARSLVHRVDTTPQEFMDYLLVANWLHKDVVTEVPVLSEAEQQEDAARRALVPGLLEVTRRA